jgi:hypothetical protein
MSELKRKPVYAIERIASVLDRKVQKNKKQTKRTTKNFIQTTKSKQKEQMCLQPQT